MQRPPELSPIHQERNWLRQWGWQEIAPLPSAAYVHIPFCRQRCGYCNFSRLANRDALWSEYL